MLVDYGPLAVLLGTWKGQVGEDVAPNRGSSEENDYNETLIFKAVGDVENAEDQVLSIVQYEQIVRKKVNDVVFHRQTGFWTWDDRTKIVCNGFTIPRRVAVLAGGTIKQRGNETIFTVTAKKNDPDWGIIEAGFMKNHASTTSFSQTIVVNGDRLNYSQSTLVNIYGEKNFEHTDQNELVRMKI